MAQQWFFSKDGKTQYGPVTAAQLKQFATSGQLQPNDFVRSDAMKQWARASQVAGLFAAAPSTPPPLPSVIPVQPAVTPPPLPPQPSAVDARRPVAAKASPAKTAPAETQASFEVLTPTTPPPVPTSGSDSAAKPAAGGSGWLKMAMNKVQQGANVLQQQALAAAQVAAEKAQVAADKAQSSVAKAAASVNQAAAAQAAKAANSPATSPAPAAAAIPVVVKPMPPLKERSARQVRDTGDLVNEEYACCWNGLDLAELNPDELLLFCTTKSHHEGSVGAKIMSFFSQQTQAKPIYHLAVFQQEVAILYVGPENKPTALRFPLEALSWTFTTGTEEDAGSLSSALSFLKKPTQAEIDLRERTLYLALKAGDVQSKIQVNRTTAIDSLKEILGKWMVKKAEELIADGRFVLAERFLNRLEADNPAKASAVALQEKLGVLGGIEADYRGGHPNVEGPSRGVLRFDSRGVEFFVEATKQSERFAYADLLKLLEPRPGKFPQEYLNKIESTRRSARAAIQSAKLARRSGNDVMRMSANLSMQTAQRQLASIKVGPPFQNRLVLALRVDGARAKLVFDGAGTNRQEVEEQVKAFFEQVRPAFDRFGKKDAKAKADRKKKSRKPKEKQTTRAKIVGCPRCKAKLRARKPGVVKCPRCETKVRVGESQFSSERTDKA